MARRKSPRKSGKKRSPRKSGKKRSPRKSGKKRSPRKSSKKRSPRKSGKKRSPRKSSKKRSPRKSCKKRSPRKSGKKRSPRKSGMKRSPVKTSSGKLTEFHFQAFYINKPTPTARFKTLNAKVRKDEDDDWVYSGFAYANTKYEIESWLKTLGTVKKYSGSNEYMMDVSL